MAVYHQNRTERSDSLVIGAGEVPEVVVSFSFAFSLYQYLVYLTRMAQDMYPTEHREDWQRAVVRVSPLFPARGLLSLIETGAARSISLPQLAEDFRSWSTYFVNELTESLRIVEDHYSDDLWPSHHQLLAGAMADVEAIVSPRKDRLLLRLCSLLGTAKQPSSYFITLVPITYESSGGYSHPVVISVEKFRGVQLVEVILHELSHVVASLNRLEATSAYGLIKAKCALSGISERGSFDLFHFLLFYFSGAIVQELISPDYMPYAEASDIYGRALRIGRKLPSTQRMKAIWMPWVHGACDLRSAVDDYVGSVGR